MNLVTGRRQLRGNRAEVPDLPGRASRRSPASSSLSDVWWFRYYTNGNIIPLDGLIKQLDIKIDDFQKSLVDDYKYAGKQWAAPLRPLHPALLLQQGPLQGRGAPGPGAEDLGRSSPTGRRSSRPPAPAPQYAYMYPALAGYAGWTLQNNLWGWGGGWSKAGTSPATPPSRWRPCSWPRTPSTRTGGRACPPRTPRTTSPPASRQRHDLLHRRPGGHPEVRQVQRRRRLPAGRPQKPHRTSAPPAAPAWAFPAKSQQGGQLAAATFI